MKFSSSVIVSVSTFFSSVAIMAPTVTAIAATAGSMDQLSASLSSPDMLLRTSIDSFVDECAKIFVDDPSMVIQNVGASELTVGSNWQLLDQPTKMCLDTMSCAFENCVFPDAIVSRNGTFGPEFNDFVNMNDTAAVLTSNQDLLNFPDYVVQARSVADVVASVLWAKEHSVPLTVKTSGHHYAGASSHKNTLNINTRELPTYSINDTAADEDADQDQSLLHECEEEQTTAAVGEEDTSYLANACRLARARGKTAIMHVGGGEVFDAPLRSVLAWNQDPAHAEGNKYMMVTGAAGTVSAAGGWVASGGNSASRGMRLYGLGVDQVLQMEMVLPSGMHVRFGPSEWETDPDYLYPKTTFVQGYCNENPVADSNKWVWKECDDDDDNEINFGDLWMAARGGGGGTWGIVMSIIVQLHPRPVGGYRYMKFLPLTNNTEEWETILADADRANTIAWTIQDFKLEFYLNPDALGVSEDDSNHCGCDFQTPQASFVLPQWGLGDLNAHGEAICLGESAGEAWAGAWKMFVLEGRGKKRLLEGGFTQAQLEEMSGWAYGNDWNLRAAAFVDSSGDDESLTDIDTSDKERLGIENMEGSLDMIRFFLIIPNLTARNLLNAASPNKLGHVPDGPKPYIYANEKYIGTTTTCISTEIVLENREDVILPLLMQVQNFGGVWYQYGGAVANGHDQMTAIPKNRREAGLYIHLNPEIGLPEVLPLMFGNESSYEDGWPGYIGHNHFIRHGTLKEDFTKPCPQAYTKEQANELCISEQESVWGTQLLAKLEKFKAEIDPGYMMTCATGVGYERNADAAALSSDTDAEGSTPVDTGTGSTEDKADDVGTNENSAAEGSTPVDTGTGITEDKADVGTNENSAAASPFVSMVALGAYYVITLFVSV